MTNYILLFLGIIYTTFLPGLVFVETLIPKFEFYKKLPLYFIFSAVISTHFSYFVSLIFGFNQITILLSIVFFLLILIALTIKKKITFSFKIKENLPAVLSGILIYSVFFVVLYQGIFKFHNGRFIMAGPNWQDTAMHLSIIESLAEGNFPPQAPYFSGYPLSYYYFADLHAAIITTLYGQFFPQVLVILNPFFAMTFFLAVYALTFSLIGKKYFSLLAGVAAVLFGNLGFYLGDRSDILQMVPMADYFLQNRPMMVGLPAVVLVVLLLQNGKYFLAGILTAALLKFQFFGFFVAWLFFVPHVRNIFKFGLPSLILGLIFLLPKTTQRSVFEIFFSTFSLGPWQDHNPIWYLEFVIKNFGLPIFVFVLSFFIKKFRPLFLISTAIFTIPFVVTFTIYPFDMFKFFYYLVPFLCIGIAVFYSQVKRQKLSLIILSFIVIFTSLTSFKVLVHAYLDKTPAYSLADYDAGLWIRESISQKSVFVTMPTVHSAVADIAGRLRIISYINWPYSHGFNIGIDNVFSRVEDVEEVYKTGEVTKVKIKYNAKYIFYGSQERDSFPEGRKLFDVNSNLREVYNSSDILIYEIL